MELLNIFLDHYEVRNTDYMLFSKACDVLSEIYNDEGNDIEADKLDEMIYECATETLGVCTSDMLSVIDVWNQNEIAEKVREYNCDLATACAYWADSEVVNACRIIKDEYIDSNA